MQSLIRSAFGCGSGGCVSLLRLPTCTRLHSQRAYIRSMGKRKVDTDSEPEILDSEEEQPKPKKSRAKKKGPVEPYTDALGWNIVPPSLLWKYVPRHLYMLRLGAQSMKQCLSCRDYGSEPSASIAAFDLVGSPYLVQAATTLLRIRTR